jgi:hypothetical protein
MQSDLFFAEEGSWDRAGRLINVAANTAVASAQKSIDLAEKSMQHLQSLDVKFNAVQTSAIFQQVVAVSEKVGLISPSAARALKRQDDVKVAPILECYSLWKRLRARMGGTKKA